MTDTLRRVDKLASKVNSKILETEKEKAEARSGWDKATCDHKIEEFKWVYGELLEILKRGK